MRLEEAKEWLIKQLLGGSRVVTDIEAAGKAVGLGRGTLLRARKELRLQCFRKGWGGPWHIALTATDRDGFADAVVAADLMIALRKRGPVKGWSLPRVVAWVSEHLLDRAEVLSAVDVPSGECLALLMWAKDHQDDFREMYDSKRMAIRGELDGKAENRRKEGYSVGSGKESISRLLAGRELGQ